MAADAALIERLKAIAERHNRPKPAVGDVVRSKWGLGVVCEVTYGPTNDVGWDTILVGYEEGCVIYRWEDHRKLEYGDEL